MSVVVKDCSYVLVHLPSFIRYGSKPYRDISINGGPGGELENKICKRVRSYEEALTYPPNQVYIGNLHPDDLNHIPQPWYRHPCLQAKRQGKFGEIIPEEEFYAWMKIADDFDLVWLTKGFIEKIKEKVSSNHFVREEDLRKLGPGVPLEKIAEKIERDAALPLYDAGTLVGSIRRDHEMDDSLKAHVLLENLLAKASGALVMHHLFKRANLTPQAVDFILSCSEEAVGDRYNRGGGSLSKAIGEMCRCVNATGHDVKAFCAAPLHAILDAACLVEAGVFNHVVVVGGGCLAKIGMKYFSHLKHEMPILEDVLAGIAFLIAKDDGINPIIRLDCIGKHPIGAASSQQEIMTSLVVKPLNKIGKKMMEIDRYATEMHNPEVTLPAGSGNTPYTNYKIMGALAAMAGEISPSSIEEFVKAKGMPGFSPTQGHVPAAVPFLGHALEAMRAGRMNNALFVAKGSLFLGRMSQLSDGMSFLLERNPENNSEQKIR
ncbi:MAG: glycine/sarcosine/betaine reductase complex component C subunit beta [Thermodesulfobacteriota bacterium]